MRYPKTEPQTVTPRQDRKPKLFCTGCGKSRIMRFVPGGYECAAYHFKAAPKRKTTGVVDTSKPERGQ